MSRVVSRTNTFAINHKCQMLGITVKLKQSHVLLHSKTEVKGSITVKNGLDLNCGDPVFLSEASKQRGRTASILGPDPFVFAGIPGIPGRNVLLLKECWY